MPHRRLLLVAVVALLPLASRSFAGEAETARKAPPAEAQKKAPPAEKIEFLRVVRDPTKKELVSLDTSIVSYAPRDCGKDRPTVDLVAAVHIGEKSYYADLNRRFRDYDVVLYELVAPEGTRIPKGGREKNTHPVSMIQSFMTDVLDLEFQLRAIDYTPANMVHADLSPEQFAEAMKKRNESFATLFLRMWGYAMSRTSDAAVGDVQLLTALFSRNRPLAMKRAFAEQFHQFGGSLNAIDGPEGSAIITDRNKRALEVLRKQIDAGKKKIAIFYGGGHMDDFDKRLRDDFGLSPVGTKWLVAWDLKTPKKK